MKKLILGGLVGIMVVGCSDKVQTLDYFVEHESEAIAIQKECEKKNINPSTDTKCYNAEAAVAKIQNNKIQKSMNKGGW